MAEKKRFAINVVMNWVAMAVGMVVPFFLSPFVVRHLGSTAYGVWILAVSTVSYLNLLDLGLRSAIVRFVSKGAAEGEYDEAQKTIGAALWFRVLISAAIAVLSVALAVAFPHLFKVPYDLQRAAQITVMLCALGVAVTLLSGVFGAVLSGIHRFDISSSIAVVQTLARAGGVLVILRSGRGLVPLAVWEFVVIAVTGVATCLAALKLFPPCRIRIRKPDVEALRKIWSYSFKTFIIIVAVQIVYYTDNMVVGHFVSVDMAAFYAIAGSLAMYTGQVSSAMGATFIPLASKLDASGQSGDLQKLLVRGTQAALGLMLPIAVVLLLRGKTFIGLWMGPKYSDISGTVLQILLITQFFTIANSTAGQIAYGVDKHKSVATWSVVEAALNLVLSIVLVKTIGLYGVAWGTSIAQVIVHMIFWPRYVKRELKVPVRTYLLEGWAKVVLCSLPFAIVCYLANRYWHPRSLQAFFLEIFITLPVYLLSVALVFRGEATTLYRNWQASRVAKAHIA